MAFARARALLCVSLVATSAALSYQPIDDEWLSFLDTPPAEAVSLADSLGAYADALVDELLNSTTPLALVGELDVVVSGGGFYDAYYLGVSMVLARAQARLAGDAARAFSQTRFAGASAGGMMPFELVLKGEAATLQTHLAYGVLTADYWDIFKHDIAALSLSDHCWRLMASWQTETYNATLGPALDGVVYLALSCLDPLPALVIVDEFTAADDQATHAFMATGTTLEMYDGMVCSDGGSMSGPDMTPLFQDGARPQLIVNLMETGYPSEMVFRVQTDQYAELIRFGMNESVGFLRTGTCRDDAIKLCAADAKTSGNVCEPQ